VEGDFQRNLQHRGSPYLWRFFAFVLTPGEAESLQPVDAGW
jgi:hypothetical protein